MTSIQACVFDFDGIIVDTEYSHYLAFQDITDSFGISFTWAEYQEHFIGFDDRDGFREMFKHVDRSFDESLLPSLVDRKAASYLDLITRKPPKVYPGVLERIQELTAGNIPLAICTGSLQCDIDPIVKQLDLGSQFLCVVTAEQVTNSKPDPEGYVVAMNRLREKSGIQFAAHKCLAIEDTPTGIQSAHGAGMTVLGLTHTHQADQLREADVVLDGFNEEFIFRNETLWTPLEGVR